MFGVSDPTSRMLTAGVTTDLYHLSRQTRLRSRYMLRCHCRATSSRKKDRSLAADFARAVWPVAGSVRAARKTIYTHPDLQDEIRAAGTTPPPRSATPPADTAPSRNSTTVAALRHQLRS